MLPNPHVLSRHRLPQPYRLLLVCFWLLPIGLLYLSLLAAHGPTFSLLHPVLLLALVGMGMPALYVWHEGVDVTEQGLIIRCGGWRHRTYAQLDAWYVDTRPPHRIFVLWDVNNRRIVSRHTAHLTNFDTLARTLKSRIRWRGWPS